MEAPTTVHFEVERPLTKEEMNKIKQFIAKLAVEPAIKVNVTTTARLHESPSIHVG